MTATHARDGGELPKKAEYALFALGKSAMSARRKF